MNKIIDKIKIGLAFIVNSVPDMVTCSFCRGCCHDVTLAEVQRCRKLFWAVSFFILTSMVICDKFWGLLSSAVSGCC